MEADPVAIDLNVDAALLLKDLVGIDSYPPVLALLPNIYNLEDRDRVRAVVAEQLAEAGILVDDRVHPAVAQWLRCLDRPDVELVVRIVETGAGGETPGMLRMSLVRTGESHVLALRNDDYVVIQPVFHEGRQLNTVPGAGWGGLGANPWGLGRTAALTGRGVPTCGAAGNRPATPPAVVAASRLSITSFQFNAMSVSSLRPPTSSARLDPAPAR
uniref:ESX secretion-associated protein EspG n=1 Tax=Nocardia cyriacigeorgica TaxID=135487 RepID=UPI002455E55F